MIDWSKLEVYQSNKYRSFEELCYQIAKGLYGEIGRFTSVDDSGGGDGVEFYLTLENGDQWGWQAKFYYPQERLSYSNRKQSITKSLKKACKTHPRLKKWILCTPTDFTPKEQEWFNDMLPQSISDEICVEFEHWGDSEFNDWLSNPDFRGKLHYFFNEFELDINSFQRQFIKQMAGVGDKFDSSLHTETNVDGNIHALLGDEAFVHQITKWIEKLEEELSDLKDAINKLNSPIPNIKWSEEEKSKVIEAAKSLQEALVNMKVQLKQARDLLIEKNLSEAQAIDWKSALDQLHTAFDDYRKIGWESGTSKMECTVEKEYEEQALRHARGVVDHPDSLVANLLDEFFPSVIWQHCLINESDLHILGDAGIGKTHIACNICDDQLKNELPALFVRGSQFRTDQAIEVQLRDLFDVPPARSWHEFLQALSAAAEAYHTRIPLIIDGLNESVHNGTFSKVWESGLTGLVREIAQTKNLVLITTCRKSYEEAIWKEVSPREDIIRGKVIWKDKDSLNLVYASGFDPYEEVEPAVEKYFKAYKIKADLTLASLTQFRHPIYLKIFCETKNRERKTEVQVYVGEQTLFEVFDEYLEQCNEAVCTRLGLRRGTPIIQPILNQIAEHLWQNCSRNIPVEELVQLTDNQLLSDLNWSLSKAHAIEAEGLLVCRNWWEGEDAMYFTYDLLGGYLIAKYLVQQAADDVQAFLNSEEVIALLFGENRQTLHPMHEDICRCLAAFLPAKTGKFLHEFSGNQKAFGLSIRALFEISPQDITKDCVHLVIHLFDEYQKNRKFFFKSAETTVGHPDHPFNASFWSNRLMAMSMSERDLSWTEYVRRNRYSFEEIVIRFETTCRNAQDLSKERLHLYAEHIMWILTSTVRSLRDQATRALYWYGRRFPEEFFSLVLKSFTINDPYVSERMLAATYGITMARQNDFRDTSFVDEVLPFLYAKQLYETMFKPNAPHATTHILARDYAKRTIDIALMHHPDLLTKDEQEHITPSFVDGGIRKWCESENKEEGPPPIQMDFENYTLRGLISYDAAPDEDKCVNANVYWRIYDLGFSLENFGKIDKWISEENWNLGRYNEHPRKIDRYGKKYSWIAFFELAGFRQDNNLLPDRYDEGRFSGADIDPSFPDEQQEYNLVTEDFLGDPEISVEEWISKTPPPDMTKYLKVDNLCGEQGPWILLQGFLPQKDENIGRNMLAFLHGLIVRSEEAAEIVEILKNQGKIDGHSIPSYPEDHRTFAGEIPWCDTYPPNKWEEFPFEVRKVLIPEQQLEFLRDGEPIPWEEEFEVQNIIADLIEKEDEERLEALLSEHNLELTIKTVEVEQREHKEFEVLAPVRKNYWEESCSVVIPHRNIALPAREITECLCLYGQPQSFDLFEKENGRRASITFQYGEKWGETQHCTYVRQDLLECYLAEIDGELIWVIWGERRQAFQNINALYESLQDAPYESFQEVKAYCDI